MAERKLIITVGEAKNFYLKNLKSNKRELAERLLLESNLCIIEERTTNAQREAFENAAEAIRVNFRNLLSKGIANKWRGINMEETLFNLQVKIILSGL
jgi:hypothetical protein